MSEQSAEIGNLVEQLSNHERTITDAQARFAKFSEDFWALGSAFKHRINPEHFYAQGGFIVVEDRDRKQTHRIKIDSLQTLADDLSAVESAYTAKAEIQRKLNDLGVGDAFKS